MPGLCGQRVSSPVAAMTNAEDEESGLFPAVTFR
jgi:hypothetical protein